MPLASSSTVRTLLTMVLLLSLTLRITGTHSRIVREAWNWLVSKRC